MKNLPYWGLSLIWLFSLLNPVLKKFDYGAGYPVVVIFALFVGVLALFWWKEKRDGGWEMLAGLGFLLLLFISWLFSEAWGIGFSDYLAYSSAVCLYLLLGFRGELEWRDKFLRTVIFGSSVAVLIGFLFYIFRDEVRMIGPFFNKLTHAHTWPNAFALFLILTWPLGFLLQKRGWRIAYFSFTLAALMLSFSRGAMIVLAGQLVLCAIFLHIRWKEVGLVAVATLLIFIGTNQLRAFNFPVLEVEEKVEFSAEEGALSADDRLVFWQGAMDLAGEKPLLGWGPYSFRSAYAGIQKELLQSADHPHNLFLKMAAEYGLPAMLLFVLLLLGNVRAMVLRRKERVVVVLAVAVLGSYAHNLIDYNLNFLANLLLLVVFMALIRGKSSHKTPKGGKAGFLWVKVLAVLLALMAVYDAGLQVLQARDYLLYPRSGHLQAQEFSKEISRNQLSAEAYFGLAIEKCENGENCREELEKAITLNPLNEFKYYRAYLQYVDAAYLDKSLELLDKYFSYVKFNRQFTAYTSNVEEAAALIDLIVKEDPEKKWLLEKKKEMLADAAHARANQSF